MSNILVPLYIYPAPGAWQPLYRMYVLVVSLDYHLKEVDSTMLEAKDSIYIPTQ